MALRAILNDERNKSKEKNPLKENQLHQTTRDRSKENLVRVRKVLFGQLVKTPSTTDTLPTGKKARNAPRKQVSRSDKETKMSTTTGKEQ